MGAGKAVHANQMGNGGDFYYAHFTPGTIIREHHRVAVSSANAASQSTGGQVERSVVLESMHVEAGAGRAIKRQSQSAELASAPSRSLSLHDPVVDLALVAEINNSSASTGLHWQAGANYERFGNMTRQQLQNTLLRTGPWSNAPTGARSFRSDSDSQKQTELGGAVKRANSRIPESFDARQQVGVAERIVWPLAVPYSPVSHRSFSDQYACLVLYAAWMPAVADMRRCHPGPGPLWQLLGFRCRGGPV